MHSIYSSAKFELLIPFLLIFPAGCSNQRNNFNTDASLSYLSQTYSINISKERPKVVLDTDMTFLGDDAFCLSILVQADNIGLIDLVGVTVTGGNSFVSVGTNAALRQLELWGRSDIPVYIGTDEPLNGFRDLEDQRQVVGSIDNWGAISLERKK